MSFWVDFAEHLKDRRFLAGLDRQWGGHRLTAHGCTPMLNALRRHHRLLGIEYGEYVFIETILSFMQDDRPPSLLLWQIAEAMGFPIAPARRKENAIRHIRKWCASLEAKGYLERKQVSHAGLTGRNAANRACEFNFRPLFKRLKYVSDQQPRIKALREIQARLKELESRKLGRARRG